MRKPSIDVNICVERRKKLGALIPGSALIVTAHPDYIRNNDVHHYYRQDSNMYYLTGFEEPESILLMRPGCDPESVLFVREKDETRETWDGFRYGVDDAKDVFQMDATYSIHDFEEVATQLLLEVDQVYVRQFQHQTDEYQDRVKDVLLSVKTSQRRSGKGILPVHDAGELIGEMRLIKSEFEIQEMQKSADINHNAHVTLMKSIKPGMSERELYGIFFNSIFAQGAQREAYQGIFASGDGATTLHYVFNDQICKDGELFLVDAGCEYNYYASDITRTYPVNGLFNETQKRIYQRLLDLQKSLIEDVKPGHSLAAMQEKAVGSLTDLMLSEKLLSGSREQLINDRAFVKYYPHGVGHWLGMDVHDTGLMQVKGEPRQLEKGMCFTIEPGIYVPAKDTSAPEELRGLGIRIEDNIVVTNNGYLNLTAKTPKEIHELEELVGSGI